MISRDTSGWDILDKAVLWTWSQAKWPWHSCVHTFPAGLLQLCASRSATIHWIIAACPECGSSARSRLVLNLRLHEHITPTLQQLHWLPIDYRITYKLCLIMHLVHISRAPQYLSDCVQTVACSSRRPGLRSSDTAAYVKLRCRTKFGECGFCYAGPAAWNSLPHHLHQINDTGLIQRRLKTELFCRAYHC